jgi:hypothetical protein
MSHIELIFSLISGGIKNKSSEIFIVEVSPNFAIESIVRTH